MELARAFTKRNKRPEIALTTPARAASGRKRTGTINRDQISSPIELLSTTNVLAYNAPNIYGDDSDSSLGSLAASSRDTTPDNSSIECSPSPVEENHLSSFFRSPGQPLLGRGSPRQSSASSDTEAPIVPSRALSHTKKSHQAVARKHTIKNTPSLTAPPASTNTRSSIDMFFSKSEADHPFGAELEQVNELAEEIGAQDVLDQEEQYLEGNGFCRFGVQEYLDEIHGLFGGNFSNPFGPFNAVWI